VDLCITQAKGRNNALGIYTARVGEWQRELAQLLEVGQVHLEMYPPEDPGCVYRARSGGDLVVVG
jgi:hypothetical protein